MDGYYFDKKTGRYEYGENSHTTPQLRYEDSTDLSAVDGIENTPEQVPGAKAASPEMGGAAGVQSAMANGGSPLDMAGSGMTSAGMMSANPYLVGAGLGVTALSSIQKGKNQREQNRYLAEVQKYNAKQSAIEKMAQIGQGLKA